MRVLVTRPEPGALRTAIKLMDMGHRGVILPMTRIVRLHAEHPGPVRADIVAVTSANAVRQAPPALMTALAHLPFVAVGPASASAVTEAGVGGVTDVAGDAMGLAREIIDKTNARRVLYLCGRVRTPDLEKALVKAGLTVDPLETYDTADLANPLEALKIATEGVPVDAVLLYSANTARMVNRLLDDETGKTILGSAGFYCISWRVAEELCPPATSRVLVSEGQNEPALLDLLGNHPA